MVTMPRRRGSASDSSIILPARCGGGQWPRRTFTDPLTGVPVAATSGSAPTTSGGGGGSAEHRPPTTSTSATVPAPTAAPAVPGPSRAFQRPAQDLPRPCHPSPACTTCARDRPGHLRELQERRDLGPASQAAVRHRQIGKSLPQRDHPGNFIFPHPRVRADGDGVLRRARHRGTPRTAPVLDRRAPTGTPTSASTATTCATTSTRRRSCPLLDRTVDIEYRFGFAGSEAGASSRASPTARTSTSPPTPKHSGTDLSVLRPGQGRALRALRHRAWRPAVGRR